MTNLRRMMMATAGVPSGGASAGSLWGWGSNGVGTVGDGTTVDKSSPVQVGALTTWASLEAGNSHVGAIQDDGTLYMWGGATYGALGNGDDTTNISAPVQLGALTDWSVVSCGTRQTHAIKTDNTLWSWGHNEDGKLGDGTTVNKSSPVQIGALTDWESVSAGDYHSLAIKTDNTLWAWGAASVGRLGDGTTTAKSSPVQIGALTDWAQVSAAPGSHSAAIKTDGTLWTWGNGGSGRLGHGTTSHLSSPTQVGALTTWAFVAASGSGTFAIKTDGTLWSWGSGSNGMLGDGTTVNKSSPVQVGALTDWSSISAWVQVLSVKTDGTLWSWGSHSNGGLGDGQDAAAKSSPVQVGALTNWSSVSTGNTHSHALKV